MKSISNYIVVSVLIAFLTVSIHCNAVNENLSRPEKELSALIAQANDSILTPSCIKLCKKIVQKAKQKKNPMSECVAYQLMSVYYYSTDDIDNILKVVDECKKVKINKNCLHSFYCTWDNAVIYYINNYRFKEAVEELERMQKYALSNNHGYGIMKSYYGLANCYQTQGQYAKAYEKYKQAQKVGQQNGIRLVGSNYLNISQNEINLHKYDEAERMLLVALKDKECSKILRVHFYSMLLNMFSLPDHKDLNKALYYKQLLEKEKPDLNTLMDVSRNAYHEALYNYYTNLDHDYAKAESYIELENDTLQYYFRKASNLSMQRRSDEANRIYQKAITFYDAKKEKEQEMLLKNYETQNDLDKALETQNALKLQNSQLKEKWQRLFIICGCVVFVLVVSMMSFYYVVRMRKMRRSKELAEISEHRKTLFLQNMSHEIRTPLNAIVGFTDLLTGETQGLFSPEERNVMVNLVQSNSELLGTLVNDILDMSKFESGTYHLKFSDINVFELCSATVETIRMRVQPGVELIYLPGDKDIILHTDAQRVQQVIINYLTNACKYTSHGSITMAYEVMDDIIRFTVTDTGMGIKPDDAEEVFKRFQMLDSKVSGTGLGLHICSLIANLVHGRVYVDTSYTGGARFVFDHPLHLEQKA